MAWGNVNVSAGEDTSGYISTELLGAANGIATLDADGLLSESQRPEVDAYTKAQTDAKISDAVTAHNASSTAHAAIRTQIAGLETQLQALKMQIGTDVTGNAFTADFDTLDDVIVTGVWNETLARVEF